MKIERYIYLALLVGLLIFGWCSSANQRKDLKACRGDRAVLEQSLAECLQSQSTSDTVIVEYEKKVPIYIRVVDSVHLVDTVFVEYERYYTDSLKSKDLDLWYDITTCGYLIGTNIRYKVRAKEIIKNNIIYKEKLIEKPETWRLYGSAGVGLFKPSIYLGGLVTFKKVGVSANYDFRREIYLGFHYRFR